MLAGSYHNGFAPRDGVPMYPELWRGCVGAWAPCLGPTGLTLRDWSGFQRHGTLTNMSASTAWAVNGGRPALEFTAGSTQVDIGNHLSMLHGSRAVSFCFWGRKRATTSFLDFGTGIAGTSYANISVNTDGRVYFQVQPNFPFVVNSSTIWQHFGLVFTPSRIQGFINGIRVVDATGPSVFPTIAANWSIGRYLFGGVSADGWQDDHFVFARALSEGEIRLLASRRGIAYDLAPRRRGGVFTAGGFKAYWAARKAQILGGGLQ